MAIVNSRQFGYGPDTHQLSLPGLGDGDEQMRLFDVRNSGPANVYTANTASDATNWRDRDIPVELDEDEREIVNDDFGYSVPGNFFEFEVGEPDRAHIAAGRAHGRTEVEAIREGNYLGADAYPRLDTGLQFEDLYNEAGYGWHNERVWTSPSGTEVGKVRWHEDEWGPNVDAAEINPGFQGRGFSREAMRVVAEEAHEEGQIIHAGSFTDAGAGAFHRKGIPTERDLERGFEDYAEAVFSEDPGAYDPEFERENFKDLAVEMQGQALAALPSRRGSFDQGWKPKPLTGKQEKLPGTA